MRVLVWFLAVLACAGLLWLLRSGSSGNVRGERSRAEAPPARVGEADSSEVDDERLRALEERVDELTRTLATVRQDFARSLEARREVAGAPAAPLAADVSGDDGRTPTWYLAQYVASFVGEGEGSEYFRLAVEAYAPSLLHEIGALVLDARVNPLLRVHLAQMLGNARLRGNGVALELCLRCVSARGAEPIVEAALGSLRRIGDGETARALEALLASIESRANRRSALQTLVALAGSDANAALARLWPGALDDADRRDLLGLLSPGEGASALEVFQLASYAAPPVRLTAAQGVGKFRFDGFAAFIDAWSARETDPKVLAALGVARRQLAEVANWSAERAAGAPNAKSGDDDPNAWASAQADMGLQWLELDYDPPLVVSQVRVFEVCVPGALTSVVAVDERGVRHELWSGIDPTASPGVFEIACAPTAFRVRTLRLTLDTDRNPGWSEIDAVELVGPRARAWASAARASSSYGR